MPWGLTWSTKRVLKLYKTSNLMTVQFMKQGCCYCGVTLVLAVKGYRESNGTRLATMRLRDALYFVKVTCLVRNLSH